MRAVPCARQSRSMAAQLVAFDSVWYCAVSAGCTAPLVFLPTSGRGSARHGLAPRPGVCSYAARAWQADRRRVERDRAPLDAEDGVPVSAVTDESGTTSSAFLVPTAPRRAWHLANLASQLVTPDVSWGVIWARHTTPNVASTTRIAARLLQRARYESEPTTANRLVCNEGQLRCEPKGAGSMAMAA
jgi:hypothetical protein